MLNAEPLCDMFYIFLQNEIYLCNTPDPTRTKKYVESDEIRSSF